MKGKVTGIFAALIVASAAFGAVWNTTWEAIPAGPDLAADLDTFINLFKAEVRQRAEVEHIWGGSTDDNGLHQVGSARCFVQDAAPTNINGGTGALGQYNSASGTDGVTVLTGDELGATTRDLGAGRCWIDVDGPDNVDGTPDDYTRWFYSETLDDWVVDNGIDNLLLDATAGAPVMFDPGKYNLLYNGSFTATDGTGSVASTTVPAGWALSGTPTIAYNALAATQGGGLSVAVTATAAANEGISQTLAGLKASTTYYVTARAKPALAGHSCSLRTTGGSVNLPGSGINTLASGTAWATVSGYFTTDGTPASVVLIAEADVDGNTCNFTYASVVETSTDRRGLHQPGALGLYTQDVTSDIIIDTVFGNNTFVSTSLPIPGPGYLVMVDASVSLSVNANDGVCMARLARDDCAGGAFSAVGPVAFMHTGNFLSGATVPLHYVDTAPVAGGTCIYRVEVREDGMVANCEVNDADLGNNTEQTGTSLRLMLMPTR